MIGPDLCHCRRIHDGPASVAPLSAAVASQSGAAEFLAESGAMDSKGGCEVGWFLIEACHQMVQHHALHLV